MKWMKKRGISKNIFLPTEFLSFLLPVSYRLH
uniref:Uncharacterized protein n=1 Tax=Rhizophora mucronata TaxID=61149 RepID=A0A2P2PRF5_RHIMU